MSEVWVIQNYTWAEDQMIWAVASSVERAAEYVRSIYGEPYIVTWEEPVRYGDDEWRITGQFTAVKGFCGDGPSTYSFTRFQVDAPYLRAPPPIQKET